MAFAAGVGRDNAHRHPEQRADEECGRRLMQWRMSGECHTDPRDQRDHWSGQNTTNNGNVRKHSQNPVAVCGIGQEAYYHHKQDQQCGPDAPGENRLNVTPMRGLPGQDSCFALPVS